MTQDLHHILAPYIQKAPNYTSDSRQCAVGSIFVALRGSQHDGHEFLPEVIKKTPSLLVVDDVFAGSDKGKALEATAKQQSIPWISVPSTHEAHRALAHGFRRKFKGKVIGIGGSAGKTTTKDFVYTLLSQKFRAMKTEHSQNGEAGIPKTLERLTPDFELAVIEIGIDAPGDMQRHEELVAPDIGVLTSIGPEHLNLLKSVDLVFSEERRLFDGVLKRGGPCFAPATDPWLMKLKGQGVHLIDEAVLPQAFAIAQPVARRNASLAVALAQKLGLSPEEIERGVKAMSLPKGRGGQFEVTPALTLIADYYNSNPASLQEGINFALAEAKKKQAEVHLVLGDMLDLGVETDACHDQVMDYLKKVPMASCLLVGPHMGDAWRRSKLSIKGVRTVDSTTQAALLARDFKQKEGVLLVKGSRGMALEKVLDVMMPGKFL